MIKRLVALTCVGILVGSVAWRVTAQVDPTDFGTPLLLSSTEECQVLGTSLDSSEVRAFALSRFATGVMLGSFRRHGLTDRFAGALQFEAPGSSSRETLHFRYLQQVSPPALGPTRDHLSTVVSANSPPLAGSPMMIADPVAMDLAVQVLSNPPSTVSDLFDQGFRMNLLVAAPSIPIFASSSLAPTYSTYLRFSDGLSVRFVVVSAVPTGTGFGPLMIRQ